MGRFYVKFLTSLPAIDNPDSEQDGVSLGRDAVVYFSFRNNSISIENSRVVPLESLITEPFEVVRLKIGNRSPTKWCMPLFPVSAYLNGGPENAARTFDRRNGPRWRSI